MEFHAGECFDIISLKKGECGSAHIHKRFNLSRIVIAARRKAATLKPQLIYNM
jgi:hypothetical protein